MRFKLKINDVQSIGAIDAYWTNEDYTNLLGELNYSEAASADPAELRELVEMAISDFEPHEAAEILLRYRLKDKMSVGQINNLSHEMADDNEAEGNANTALHYALFNINQLLRAAFNGTFPDARASKIAVTLSFKDGEDIVVTKELILKAICKGLSDKCPLIRVFEDQLEGREPFGDAVDAIWELHSVANNEYSIITSDYWFNDQDINEYEFTGSIKQFEEKA